MSDLVCLVAFVVKWTMKLRSPFLLISFLAATSLVSGCVTARSKTGAIASCCATNLQPGAEPVASEVLLPGKSIYQIDSTWTTDSSQPLKLAALRGRPQIVA